MRLIPVSAAILAVSVTLCACQNSREVEAQQEWNHCSANGTEKNLDKINSCLTVYNRAQQAKLQDRQIASRAMMAASLSLLSQGNQAPVIQPPPMPRRTYCTTQYNSFLRQYQTICQ